MKWIQTNGSPLIIVKKNEAYKWEGILNNDYSNAEKISYENYISKLNWDKRTVLILGDEAMLTTAGIVNNNVCIIRWHFAPSVETAELIISHIKLKELPLQETLTVNLLPGEFVIFDSIEPFNESIPQLTIDLNTTVNQILTYKYNKNDVSLIIHELKYT